MLAAELDVNDPSATAAFLATLPPAEEAFLTGLLMDKPFPQPDARAARFAGAAWSEACCWNASPRWKAGMRLPDVSSEEITRLQKEVLDLQLRLKDIARL